MSIAGLPSPLVPVSSQDGGLTRPWYFYLKSADDTWRPSMSVVDTSAAAIVPNNGVTLISATTPSSAYTLSNPIPGVRKVIIVESASTACKVVSTSTVHTIKPGTGWKLAFATSGVDKVVELVGVSTSGWYIVSNPGSATVTT